MSEFGEESKSFSKKYSKHLENIIHILKIIERKWAKDGETEDIKLDTSQGFYYLYLDNFYSLEPSELNDFLSKFNHFSIYEMCNGRLRVKFKNEKDLRDCYNALKEDFNYKVKVAFDVDLYLTRVRKRNKTERLQKQSSLAKDNLFKDALKLERKIFYTGKVEESIKSEVKICRKKQQEIIVEEVVDNFKRYYVNKYRTKSEVHPEEELIRKGGSSMRNHYIRILSCASSECSEDRTGHIQLNYNRNICKSSNFNRKHEETCSDSMIQFHHIGLETQLCHMHESSEVNIENNNKCLLTFSGKQVRPEFNLNRNETPAQLIHQFFTETNESNDCLDLKNIPMRYAGDHFKRYYNACDEISLSMETDFDTTNSDEVSLLNIPYAGSNVRSSKDHYLRYYNICVD